MGTYTACLDIVLGILVRCWAWLRAAQDFRRVLRKRWFFLLLPSFTAFCDGEVTALPLFTQRSIEEIVRADEEDDRASQSLVEGRS